jgi:hypothetical protein
MMIERIQNEEFIKKIISAVIVVSATPDF